MQWSHCARNGRDEMTADRAPIVVADIVGAAGYGPYGWEDGQPEPNEMVTWACEDCGETLRGLTNSQGVCDYWWRVAGRPRW